MTYLVNDYFGGFVRGALYEQEMQKVKYPDIWLVDEILKDEGKGAKRKLFVSWVGYPKSFNNWIPYSQTQKV